MKNIDAKSKSLLKKLAFKYEISLDILKEYFYLFVENNIPISYKSSAVTRANRILMISTHGYWGNPPPTGLPDTGGQTYYVLEVSKAWAKQGRQVIIIARWFEPYHRVEFIEKNLWLIRVPSGSDDFVRKEDIYKLVPQMAEAATGIAALFGCQSVVGHYADGMAASLEVGERLEIPVAVISHSLGIRKLITMEWDPYNPDSWFDPQYNFFNRESYELAAIQGANLEIANTPREPEILHEYYNLDVPHKIMQAGAGSEFFEVFKLKPPPTFLSDYGLTSKKYLVFYGRFSEAKNIHGTVAVLGEAKRLNPKLFEDIKIAIIGGSRREPLDEEKVVDRLIVKTMEEYGLHENDVVRIYGHQDRPILTALIHHSLCYVGMQFMEPFGMAVAEAMATGTAVVISEAAGITKWLHDMEHVLVVNPHDPKMAAQKLIDALKDKKSFHRLAKSGQKKAAETFSWLSIAKIQAKALDDLCKGLTPQIDVDAKVFDERCKCRVGRGYHRATFSWQGFDLHITDQHKEAAKGILEDVKRAITAQNNKKKRAAILLIGKDASGAREISAYLSVLLRKDKLAVPVLSGKAFSKFSTGKLNLNSVQEVIDESVNMERDVIYVPSICKNLSYRRYDQVPISMKNKHALVISLDTDASFNNATIFKINYPKE